MALKIFLVIIGGGIGSAGRYLLTVLATRLFGNGFPWGTLGVNLGGCFLMGFGFALADKGVIPPFARLLLMTGFLGGLTTFSTYSLESMNFFRSMEVNNILMNIAFNNIGGLALVFIGIWLGRSI
jgi:CrcB protein